MQLIVHGCWCQIHRFVKRTDKLGHYTLLNVVWKVNNSSLNTIVWKRNFANFVFGFITERNFDHFWHAGRITDSAGSCDSDLSAIISATSYEADWTLLWHGHCFLKYLLCLELACNNLWKYTIVLVWRLEWLWCSVFSTYLEPLLQWTNSDRKQRIAGL